MDIVVISSTQNSMLHLAIPSFISPSPPKELYMDERHASPANARDGEEAFIFRTIDLTY